MGRAKKFFKKAFSFVTDQFVITKHGDSHDNSISGNNLIKNKLYGHGGDDTLKAFGARNELYGGSGDDYLRAIGISNKMRGDSGNDRLVGLGAHNDMRGGTGDDALDGIGAYNDMRGEDGNDVMRGLGAYNKMDGGSGDDKMIGLGAYNRMNGGSGNDKIEAIGGVNNAYGGDGNDKMLGIGGVNLLDGGSGDDDITAVGGVNSIKAGAGNDTVTAIGGVNTIYSGAGKDRIVAAGGVNVISGGSDEDRILAVGGVNVIDGGSEDDVVVALGGINVVNGGTGDDILISAGGVNTMNGGEGKDIMIAAATVATVQDGGAGDDVMIAASNTANVQKGGDGNDKMIALSVGVNVQHGGTGDDIMIAGGGGNVQYGDDGDDIMIGLGLVGNVQHGGDGDDIMVAVGQGNVQFGGKGQDILIGLGYYGNVQHGGTGDDIMFGLGRANLQIGDDGNDTMVALGEVNVQIGGAGNDTAFALGPLGYGNLQLGGSGNDILVAGGRMNIQHGGADNDIMVAVGQGNLQMGSGGSDILIGLGKGNVQFGGEIWDAVPEGLALDNQAQDNMDEKVAEDLEEQAKHSNETTETNLLVAAGKGNLQFGDAERDIAIGLGEGNLQKLGGGSDIGVAMAKKGSVQFGESGNDIMLNMQVGPKGGAYQSGGADNDTMITFFGGTNKKPVGVQLGDSGDDVMAMISQDFYKELFEQKKAAGDAGTSDKKAAASSAMTFQSGGSGNDTFIDLATGTTLRSGGSGNDAFFSLGKGGIAFGGAGNDLMIGGYKQGSFYSGGSGDDVLLDMKSFAFVMLNQHLVRPATEFVTKMVDNMVDDILAEVQFIIDGVDGVFTGVADFLAALEIHFPGVALPDIPYRINLDPVTDTLQKLLDALNLDIPLTDVLGSLADKIGDALANAADLLDTDLIDAVSEAVSSTVTGLVNQVTTAAMNMAKVAELAFDGFIETVLDGAELVIDGVEGAITGIQAIGEYLGGLAEDARAAFFDALPLNLPELTIDFGFDFLPDFDFLGQIDDFAGAIIDAIKSFDFSAGFDFVDHIAEAMGQVIKSLADAVSLDGMRELLNVLSDGLADGIEGIAAFFDDFPDFDGIVEAITGVIPDLGSVPDVLGKFAPDGVEELASQLMTVKDMKDADNLLGGDGDDVFGIADDKTKAFGGAGNDTFQVQIDAIKDVTISDMASKTGIVGSVLDSAKTALAFDGSEENETSIPGGMDVVELRGLMGVAAGNISITYIPDEIPLHGGKMLITYINELQAGQNFRDIHNLLDFNEDTAEALKHIKDNGGDTLKRVKDNMKIITLKGMGNEDTRIETLRLVGLTGETTEIDLAGALDAGVFGLVPTKVSFSSLADFVTTNDAALASRLDLEAKVADGTQNISDGFVKLANDIKDAGEKIVEDGKKLVGVKVEEAPDHTEHQETYNEETYNDDATADDFLTEKEKAAMTEEGGAKGEEGAEGQTRGDLGQHGELRLGDVEAFTVNSVDVKEVQTTQTLAMSDGSVLVLFAVLTHGGKAEIHGQRLDSSGNKAGEEFVLETDSVSLHHWEAIALENNEFALRANYYKNGEHRFLATPDGGVIKLADPADGTFFKNYVKQVTLANGGSARIDNLRFFEDEGAAAVNVTNPDGTTVRAEAKFAGSNLMRQGDIVALADGGFAVAFQHTYGDRDIFVRIYNEDGSARTGYLNPAANQAAHSEHSEPHLAALADGSFVLVYNKDEGADEIHMLRLSAHGEQIGEPFIIEGARAHPSVAATADGRVVITHEMPGGQVISQFVLLELDFQGSDKDEVFAGGNADDIARGGDGNDAVFGGLGDDLLEGEGGNDFLEGGIGDDALDGGAGHDILGGGIGDDILSGGADNDIFFFVEENVTSFGNDTITDFTKGEDLIDLLGVLEVDSFDDLLIEQDGADAVVKVLTDQGVAKVEKVFLLDGVEVSEEEAQAAAGATATGQDGPTLETRDREVNTIRLEGVDASTLTEDDFAHSGNTVGEFGTIELSHQGVTVETLQTYVNPVVVAFVKTSNGIEPVEVRASAVSGNSFHIKLQEAADQDQIHADETVSYMVVEAGTHTLANGAVIQAGTVDTDGLYQSQALESQQSVAFDSDAFDATSHVFATVNTQGGGSFATARIDDITEAGFKVGLAKSEDLNVELVKNGDFASGGANWTHNNPTGNNSVYFGHKFAQFNSGNETSFGDSIQQTIQTADGANYQLNLDLMEIYNKGSHDFKIEVLDELGQVIEFVESSVAAGKTKPVALTFTATSDATTIKITNTGATTSISTDGLVDNVSVKEVIDVTETVGFIAFQDGAFDGFSTGSITADHNALVVGDTFDFAQITGMGDLDSGVVRQDLDAGTIHIQEETSLDAEILHAADEVSFLVLDQPEGFFLI